MSNPEISVILHRLDKQDEQLQRIEDRLSVRIQELEERANGRDQKDKIDAAWRSGAAWVIGGIGAIGGVIVGILVDFWKGK